MQRFSLLASLELSMLLPVLLVCGCFLPYLGSSYLNGRHIVTYSLFVWVLLGVVNRGSGFRWRGNSLLNAVIRLWLFLFFVVCLATVFSWLVLNRPLPGLSRMVASLEQYIQPLVIGFVLLVGWTKLDVRLRMKSFAWAMNFLIWLLSANVLMIIYMFSSGKQNLFMPWLPPSFLDDQGVWLLSMERGRTGGIFNQPIELGIAHSVALFGWGHLQAESGEMPFWETIRFLLLVVGGVFAVTKVFLLGGLPAFIVFVAIYKKYRRSILNWKIGVIFMLSVFGVSLLPVFWDGFEYFRLLFQVDKQDYFVVWTAGRYWNEGVSGLEHYSEIWRHSPWIGFGFSPYEVLDSGPLAIIASSGLIGLIAFGLIVLLVIAKLSLNSLRRPDCLPPLFVFIVMLAACLGAFSFVVNKGGTIFWVYFVALLSIIYENQVDGGCCC